jgi:hypothetical protein
VYARKYSIFMFELFQNKNSEHTDLETARVVLNSTRRVGGHSRFCPFKGNPTGLLADEQ